MLLADPACLQDDCRPDDARRKITQNEQKARSETQMLKLESLQKTYRTGSDGAAALSGVSFEVAQGDFFTLLGPSGCGKTTTLQCIAGLETPDSGRIEMGGEAVFCS